MLILILGDHWVRSTPRAEIVIPLVVAHGSAVDERKSIRPAVLATFPLFHSTLSGMVTGFHIDGKDV